MSVEVDGISGATLTSTGVIDAINLAIQAAMGKQVEMAKTYKKNNIEIRTSNKVTELLIAHDTVTGVKVQNAMEAATGLAQRLSSLPPEALEPISAWSQVCSLR